MKPALVYLNISHEVPQRSELNACQMPQANTFHIKNNNIAVNRTIDANYYIVKHVECLSVEEFIS